MADLDYIYHDIALTNQFDDATDFLEAEAPNGDDGDMKFYVGTPNAGKKLVAASDPGVDDIVVSIVDASPGSGVEASHIKLALTQSGLNSASAGASLDIGVEVAYGSPKEVWYRWSNSVGSDDYTEISLQVAAINEVTA